MEQPELNDTSRLSRLYAGRVAARGVPDGSACVAPEAILAVVRREGREADRLATLEHVMSCSACHREYEWLTAVDQAALEACTSAGRPWWRAAPLALAASLLAAVGAALLVRQALPGGVETERGTSGDIALVGPPADLGGGDSLTFVWRPAAGASSYVLEVQRADGSVAFSDTTADTTVTLAEPGQLLPESDYRWWVREVTDGAEPRSSALRRLRLPRR